MKKNGILFIDGYAWSLLKMPEDVLNKLDEDKKNKIMFKEKTTFENYHTNVKQWIESTGGTVWNTIGDCTIASGFPTIEEAVLAAKMIQMRLTEFNETVNQIGAPLYVRIGVSEGNLPDIPKEKRGEHSDHQLDEAGHLEKDCPPGRIRISESVFEKLRFGRHDFRPGLTIIGKAKSAGSYVWVDKMLSPREHQLRGQLTQKQKQCLPPVVLSSIPNCRGEYRYTFKEINEILKSVFVIIGETREESKQSAPVSHAASTSDAVGAFEILSALQSTTSVFGGIDEWVDSIDMASQSNLLVIGSPSVNLFAYAFNGILPAGFQYLPEEPMRIRIGYDQDSKYFPQNSHHSNTDRHYGMVLLTHNPVNPKYNLVWIAGISGIATQAAARFVRDCVINPERTLRKIEGNSPNIAIVKPVAQHGFALSDYRGMWRINDYEIVWVGDQNKILSYKPVELTIYSASRH